MLSSIYAKLASILFSKIIPSIDTKQISVQNKDGLLSFENLEINPILFIKAKIPFDIKRGIIKTIKISLNDQNESLSNRLQISLNDIYIYCVSKSKRNFPQKDSQNLLSNLKGIFDHFLSSFVSSIGSFFDIKKIKIDAQNFHIILQNTEDENIDISNNKLVNNPCSLLRIKVSTISLEPILNDQNDNSIQRNLRFSSISITLYNIINSLKIKSCINASADDFINSINSFFENSEGDQLTTQNLFSDDFSISCRINSNADSTNVKIDIDSIKVKSKLNQLYNFVNNNKYDKDQITSKLWSKTYRLFLKKNARHNFNINTALSFLKNRDKYLNIISSETDPEKLSNFIKESQISKETEDCLKLYSSNILLNISGDQINIQSSHKTNFSLSIPSIIIEFQDIESAHLTLQFDQLNGQYYFDNTRSKGSFLINDFIINGTKVSQSQPFLSAQDDINGQVINLSKCLFIINKEYENDETDKVDYLKMLGIEKQLSEYKMLIQMINLLGQSQMLNHFLLLGQQKKKMTFNGDSCLIQLQYFNKKLNGDSNLNEEQNNSTNQFELPTFDFVVSVNSFTIQFNKFRFENALIDFGGFNLNKNQILLPLKFTINSNKFMNSLDFSSELIEIKMNGPAFKKSVDIFKAIKSAFNIQQNIDLYINVAEAKIHLSVNLVVKCSNFCAKQKIFLNNESSEIDNIFSLSFKEFKILDCNQLFLSSDSYKMKRNEIYISNLIFILNASALNYIFSMFPFNKMKEKYKITISNISVKLPFSEITIFTLIDKLKYDGEEKIMIENFTAKSSQSSKDDNSMSIDENSLNIIDPISFDINIFHSDDNQIKTNFQLDYVNMSFEPEEIKNILEVVSFFQNFLTSKDINFESIWKMKLIKFSLIKQKSDSKSPNSMLACIEINSFESIISIFENTFSLKLDCQSIVDSKDETCKFIECQSPISLVFKYIDKYPEASLITNDIDLFLSPELIMYNIDFCNFSAVNLVDFKYSIQVKNMNLSFYSNNLDENDIFEAIHIEEMQINSIKKGNFSFVIKNMKSLSGSFELPTFELQMIDSVIKYDMSSSCVQINTDSHKLEKFMRFFSDINLNLPSFLTFGIDINLNKVMINLIDTKQTISFSKFIIKANTLKRIAVISLDEILCEELLYVNNILMQIHFHVDDPNSEEHENKTEFHDLNDFLNDFDVNGDVLNPIHYQYIDILTKINHLELTLNHFLYLKIRQIFNYMVMKLFKKRNNRWLINEMKLNLSSFEQEISFVFKNVNTLFPYNEKQFHMKINDADILPGNLLTKKSSDDVFISIDYDFCNAEKRYLSILIKESFLKLNINSFFTIYNLFASINNFIPLSLTAEKLLISFDYENESLFHIFLDFKIIKNTNLLYNYKQEEQNDENENENENKTAFEIESNVISMNFVERKPLVENMKISLKIDNKRNLSFSISDCSFLLSSFIREMIRSLISQLKRMTFLIDKIIFNAKRRLLLNSVTITAGKIVFVFCKVSFQPSYRITVSPFSTHFKSISSSPQDEDDQNDNYFDVFSSIDFVNEKINDWDYLVEPFKLSISPSLFIFKDEINEGFYHYFKLKVKVNDNYEHENLNINLPLSILNNHDIFGQEEKDAFEKISQKNKLFELPDLFIKNNLNTHVSVTITPKNTFFVIVPQQLLPVFIDTNPSMFEIKVFDKTIKFTLDEIAYPTIFSTCLSVVKRGRRIELNSPVQIQSRIDKISIDLYEKGDGEFVQLATLEPNKLYPMFFNSNKPKECLFVIENEKIKEKKPNTVLISPFDAEGDQNSVIITDNIKYNVLIKVANDKSGKIVKLYSAVVCQNLLPFSVFIRIKEHKGDNDANCDQFPICKNEIVDLLSVNPETGSKFYAELSMNGIDFSSPNKLLIDLVPSIDSSIHMSSSTNFLLDLNSETSLKSQTMTIFDCRIEKEIVINVKFELLSNGQIKMVLFSPFIFANLTDSDVMILNGNLVTHLPIHNWSILSPKSEGLIFTQKDDKIILSIDGFEKQAIEYNLKNQNNYFQSLFIKQENDDIQNDQLAPRRKSSAIDSLLRLFIQKNDGEDSTSASNEQISSSEDLYVNYMPLRVKISRHKLSNEIVEMIISDLITIQNDTDLPVVFEFMSILPHSTAKIKNIRKIHELSFHFAGSKVLKTISLDVLDNKLNNQDLKGDFKASFLIEDDKEIEINAINQEVNLLITLKYSSFPTPLTITNELLGSNDQPISLKVYHTNPNKILTIPPFTTSNFYYDDLQNLSRINVVFSDDEDSKSYVISLLNETGPVQVVDSQRNIEFYVTVKMNHTKELLKSVIFTRQKSHPTIQNENVINILNFFRFKVDFYVPSILTSIIDLNMNEILLFSQKSFSFSIDNKFDYNKLFMAFMNHSEADKFMFNKYGIQTICKGSIQSLQIDLQSSVIPRAFAPTIFKSFGDDQFISFTFFANSTNKYLNAYLSDSIEVSSDPVSLSFFKKLMKNAKSKFSIGKFDWFEISPFSFHFSYLNISSNADGSIARRRSSFSISDALYSNLKSTTVSIPGIVFGQFDGNFFNNVLKIYLEKFIKPSLAASIPTMHLQTPKEDEGDAVIDVNIEDSDLMTKKICENLATSYECVNRSSLVSLALLLVNEKLKTPSHMMSIIAGLTSFSKNVKKYRNGFIFYFSTKEKNKQINDENDNGKLSKNRRLSVNSNNQESSTSNEQQMQQSMRLPRCYPRFIIGNYDEDYSRVLILIRNRFRNKERVRMISKCTVTNDVIVLTDSYLVIISPTLEYISNEISILEIQSVVIVENELRISGKKESEKMMLRLDSENTSKRFSIFIASQRLSLGMFGMSMIDK